MKDSIQNLFMYCMYTYTRVCVCETYYMDIYTLMYML